jgi:hypothetical protein
MWGLFLLPIYLVFIYVFGAVLWYQVVESWKSGMLPVALMSVPLAFLLMLVPLPRRKPRPAKKQNAAE